MTGIDLVLSFLFIFSNMFWAYICILLTNKMMSRTYWEYNQAKVIPKGEAEALKNALKDVKVKEKHPNELDQLDEMISKIMPL